jgi:outer membrane beta-barrel protein
MRRFTTTLICGSLMALVLATAPVLAEAAPAAAPAAKKASGHSGSGSIWDKDEAVVPIEDQVAIRHRYELRSGRFEVGPSFAFTLNRAFMNAFLIGLRAQYHINDYLSVGTEWNFGINFRTPLTNELDDTYKNEPNETPNPQGLFDENVKRLSRIDLIGDVRLNFTPFSGKMGIFSALFIGYDFYVFAGMAFGKTSNDTEIAEVDETNEAFNVGFAWGLGLHVYVNNWISVGLEFKDLMFADNETGQDVTRGREQNEQDSCTATNGAECRLVNGDDRRFLNHFFFGLNVTFFFPMQPEIAF